MQFALLQARTDIERLRNTTLIDNNCLTYIACELRIRVYAHSSGNIKTKQTKPTRYALGSKATFKLNWF